MFGKEKLDSYIIAVTYLFLLFAHPNNYHYATPVGGYMQTPPDIRPPA